MTSPTPARLASGTISPGGFVRTAQVMLTLLTLIVFTGVLVRLTQSGLGCEDWPRCSEDRFVPEWGFHEAIEFGNRLFSAVVGLGAMATVFAAIRRVPQRPDLTRWSWSIAALVLAQAVLGGITVLVDLHPLFVSSHFLLSIVSLWMAMVLLAKARGGIGEPTPLVAPGVINHSLTTIAAASLLLVTGTVVTGTGPNSGDFRADRFNLDLEMVARVHGVFAWVVVALLVTLVLRLRRSGVGSGSAQTVVAAAVVQGGIGYLQYATGVPPALVMLHVIGAVTVWLLLLRLHFALFRRPQEVGVPSSPGPADGVRHEAQFSSGPVS